MRTKIRSTRQSRYRGFASLVSFLLLFAFALGQGSIAAEAENPHRAVTEDAAPADEGTVADTPAETPAEEAPADPAPAEEALADEPPADAPADTPSDSPADVPASDAIGGDSGTSSGGGADSESSDGSESSARSTRSARNAGRIGAVAAPAAADLVGGDIDLDFVAAGPFTYDHSTGVGPNPPFGFNDRTIDKSDGVVESLESGDFQCGDLVTFFTQIVVDGGADAGGAIDLDYEFDRSTTGQDGILYTDIIDSSVAVNTDDDGNVGLDGNETATLIAEDNTTDPITGTVRVAGLDAGDTVIVRLSVELDCIQGSTPTGNLLAVIADADVVGGGNIPVGNQTVPMKTTGFVPEPAIDIEKSCPAEAAFGDDIKFEITITNNGNEDLENIVVMDTVDGKAPVDISNLFADTLAAGDSETQNFVYSPDGTEPDPITNSVTVTADGVNSETEVTDTAQCDTDITHEPGIDVIKSCPDFVLAGEDISYTITVENTGNEPLENVTVTDTLLGDITDQFDFDFTDPFPVGETATANVTYTPQAGDPDPLTNTVDASGVGADSGDEATASDNCTTDILNPSISVTKSCTLLAHVGETVVYEITVTNNGDEDLTNVTVVDTILGDLSASFADDLAVGASETQSFDHVITESDADPLVNEVTATGTGVQSEGVVDDTATCVTDVIHPGIVIVKSVDEDVVPVGTTVTFTYVVTNTGDTTLFDVTVDDNVLGHIGDIPILEPGQSVTLTKDFVVGNDPVTNVATASGEDVLGRSVSSSDAVTVSPIAGENPPPPTPFTGSDAGRLGLIAMALLGLGATLVAVTRRRRTEDGTS